MVTISLLSQWLIQVENRNLKQNQKWYRKNEFTSQKIKNTIRIEKKRIRKIQTTIRKTNFPQRGTKKSIKNEKNTQSDFSYPQQR